MAENEKDKDKAAPPTPGGTSQAVKPGPVNTDRVVDQWFQEFFPGARTARGEAWWQEAERAKEILKERLKGD